MLKQEDTIGIIALAGVCDKEVIEHAQTTIENLGYKVKLSKNIFNKNNYLAGLDKDKLDELYNFFEDESIKLILNARGGYGSLRLINQIDYERIKKYPKPFCGFSDITALLLMLHQKCGFKTLHGPMASSDFYELDEFTWQSFTNALNNDHLEFNGNKIINSGNAEGILFGGNLSTVVSLCGQDFIPDKDFIFFTEDLNEPVYKIDKMFTQLFNIESFKNNCKGIVLGDFLNTDNTIWLNDFFKTLPCPTIAGFRITHERQKITLPIGEKASIDGSSLKICKHC